MDVHISGDNVVSYKPRAWNFTTQHRDAMEEHMLGGNTDSRLMSLPLEIRMEIYGWLHLMSPVLQAQLAPWYPSPSPCEYIVKPVCVQTDEASDAEANEVKESSSWDSHPEDLPSLLSPHRPLSGLPSALLRANSEIYYEARHIPFEKNEFVFVNWFASGLWSARAFTRRLKPWQREHLNQVRLEVENHDFGGTGFGEWQALCSDWVAVTGLRMKMVVGHKTLAGTEPASKKDLTEQCKEPIADGLRRMKRLERVEMELATDGLDEGEKMTWCRELEELLRESGMATRVLCTEKASKKGVPKLAWLQKEEPSVVL